MILGGQSTGFEAKLPRYTLPETNIAPENQWLEDYVPLGFRPISMGTLLVLGSIRDEILPTYICRH